MKIKKGDLVRVLSGKDKGAEGHVMSVDTDNGRITVEGVHTGRKHQPPTQQNDQGGIIHTTKRPRRNHRYSSEHQRFERGRRLSHEW